MRTSKPISTVSYNSPDYLRAVLDRLVESGLLTAWAYIYHQPEEGERKVHAHVFLEPSKQVQTDDLRKLFAEPDPSGNPKSLGCMPMRKSELTNWWLYGLHDPGYLARKGERREYVYQRSDIVTSDDDYFDRAVKGDTGEHSLYTVLRMCADAHMSIAQVYASGYISPGDVLAVSKLYPAICEINGIVADADNPPVELVSAYRTIDEQAELIIQLRERIRDLQCQCQLYSDEIVRLTGYSCPF